MKWYMWLTGMIMLVFCTLAGFASSTIGVFVDGGADEPWGELAGLLFGAATAGGVTSLFTWLIEEEIPDRPKRLPRAERKKLRAHADALRLQREIEKLEREELPR